MNNIRKILVLFVSVMFIHHESTAQFETMLSQYSFNELNINPAYAGSRESISGVVLNRDQWSGIQGAPNTSMVSLHSPIYNKKGGVGISYLNETIGVSRRTSFNLNGAYRIAMKERSLSFGLQFSFVSLSENLLDLNLPQDELFLMNSGKMHAKNVGFGFYYSTQKYYIGASVPRMLYNQISVKSGSPLVSTKMQMNKWHYYIMAGKARKISSSFVLRSNAFVKIANGAPIQLDLNVNGFVKDRFWAGFGIRTKDALVFLCGIQIGPQFRIGYAHDFTTSRLQGYSNGTNEIALGIDIGLKNDRLVSPRYF
jgi:type IX secretion system PorP/SprF family membrane protein